MIRPGYTRALVRVREFLDGAAAELVDARLAAQIVIRAKAELGRSEAGRNNYGGDLIRYGAGEGEAWCAAFASTVIRWACEDLDLDPLVPHELGAKALFRAGLANGYAVPGRLVRPGDLVCWDRDPVPWWGHIGIVVDPTDPNDGIFESIEGNVGKFPAEVARFPRRFDDPKLVGFARLSVPLLGDGAAA